MADIDGFKPRRKLVTYGKPVKKFQTNVADFDSLHTTPVLSTVSLPFDEPIPVRMAPHREFTPDDSHNDSLSVSNGNGSVGEKHVFSIFNAESNVGSRGRLHKAVKRDTRLIDSTVDMFDVPSSDEDGSAASGTMAPRKRRRLSPATIDMSKTVYNESSLQRHIASEMADEHPKPLHAKIRAVGRPNKAQKRLPSASKAPPRALRSRAHSVDAGMTGTRDRSSDSRSSQSSTTSVKATGRRGKRAGTPGNDVASQAGISNRGRSKTPKQTPPPNAKSTFTSSPLSRQAVLLNQLLENAAPENSPSRLGLKRLTLIGSAEVSPGPESVSEQSTPPRSNGVKGPQELRRPRQRLIDALGDPTKEKSDRITQRESSDSDSDESMQDQIPQIVESQAEESASVESSRKSETVTSYGSQIQSASQATGPIITYSKQRSYLSETVLDEIDALADIPEHQPQSLGFGFGGDSQASVTSVMEDDSIAESGTSGGWRSIHELRQAGGNFKLQKDIDYIFEDLDDKSKGSSSRRRGGLMELCMKLMEPAFARQFLDSGMVHRFTQSVDRQADSITTFLIASVLSLLLCGGAVATIDARVCCEMILDSSPSLLGEQRDLEVLARERQFNISKASRALLINLQQSVKQSRIWEHDQPQTMSPRMIALRSIDLAIRRLREMGDFKKSLPTPTIKTLIAIVTSRVTQQSPYSPGDFLVIKLTVSILESHSIAVGSIDEPELEAVERLSALGPLLSIRINTEEKYAQVQTLTLRLILNLTNYNPLLCEKFSTPELISATSDIITSQFCSVSEQLLEGKESTVSDSVLLALGSLINFTEWSSIARDLMAQLTQDTVTYLELLLRLFLRQVDLSTKAESVAETHSLVPFGYLSVLLCTICLSPKSRAYVRKRLNGRNLNPLLGAAENFLKVYKKVEEDAAQEDDPRIGFTARLQGIVDRLREAEK